VTKKELKAHISELRDQRTLTLCSIGTYRTKEPEKLPALKRRLADLEDFEGAKQCPRIEARPRRIFATML